MGEFRHVAAAGYTDTHGAVDEAFQFDGRLPAEGGDILQGQLTGQVDPAGAVQPGDCLVLDRRRSGHACDQGAA